MKAAKKAISFTATKNEMKTIRAIADRAVRLGERQEVEVDRISTEMDILATHANGCPLRLDELLAADDFNFLHDVYGIARHLNRETGNLMNCFRPRFSQPSA